MELWDEAEKFSIAGTEVYAFGLMTAIGTLCAAVLIVWLARRKKLPAGAGLLTALLSIAFGAICSRIAFCLMNRELGFTMPLSAWADVTGGGWSMMGLVGGVLLGAWTAGKWLKTRTGATLDIACCAIPAFMCFERAGEYWIPEFDYSRTLDSPWLSGSFLALRDGEDAYLATYRLAAAFSLVLLGALLFRALRRKEREGNLCIAFLLLLGAGSILLESLRYDLFLSIHFVGLQQILALVFLLAGSLAAAKRAGSDRLRLRRAALASVPVAALITLGLEFALDRTTFNKFAIYAVMTAALSVAAVLGLRLLSGPDRELR